MLITGANRGIGLALTKQYLKLGWQVQACCRCPAEAVQLNELGPQNLLDIYALDVCDSEQLKKLSMALSEKSIDVLFSNAGVYGPKGSRFGDTPVEDWLDVFKVNSIAPLKLAEAFVEQVSMSEHKTMAVVSSLMGSMSDNGYGNAYIYRSSKAAVNSVVKSLSIDLAGRGVKAVTLHPGWVKTDMGGDGALISSKESAAGLVEVVNQLTVEQSGQFYNYRGEKLDW